MSRRGAVGLMLRQARADWPVLGVVAMLVLVSAFLAAAAPRAFNVVTDEALHDALDDAPVSVSEVTARSTNGLPWTQLRSVDATLTDLMPEALQDVLGDTAFGVTSARYETFRPDTAQPFRPRPFAWLTLRYQSGLLDQVRWVDGHAPRRAVAPSGDSPAQLDIALAADVAKTLDMQVGDRMRLELVDDPVAGGTGPVVRVSGLFQPLDPTATGWAHERLVLSRGVEVTSTGDVLAEYAAALIAEDQVEVMQQFAPLLDYDWHYQVRADALDGGNADAVLAAIEQTTAAGVNLDPDLQIVLGSPPSVTVSSGVIDRLAVYTAQAATAAAVSSLVLAGLFAVALLVLALAAQVSVQRRGAALALARGRGASSSQVAGVLALETALAAGPAALAGYAAAVWLVPARPAPLSVVLVVVLLVACVSFVSLGGWLAHRAAPGVRRSTTSVTSRSRRRLVVEAMVVLLAAGGLVLLRRRGLESSAGGADPFLSSVPVLLALAAGTLVLRAYPWLLRPLFRLVGRRTGPVAFVSFARGARQPLASTLPMAVLLLGLGFAVFASAVQATVSQGQGDAAWGQVGADYRAAGSVLLPDELADLAATDGVDQTAPAFAPGDAELIDSRGRFSPLRFVAVDPARYLDVTEPAPAGVVPRGDLAALAQQPEAVDDVLPAVVSPEVADTAEDGEVTVSLGSGFGDITVSVAGVADSFPTDEAGDFVVADLAAFRTLDDEVRRANEVFVSAPASSAGAITRTIETWHSGVSVEDRRELESATAQVALVEGTVSAFRLGVVAAAGYCLLATLLALVLTGRQRAELVSILRIVGLSRGQVAAIVALEMAPLVGVVVLTGWAVGLALPYLLVPAIDLTTFTGGLASPTTHVDLVAAGLLGLGLVLVVGMALAGTVATEHRRRESALRIGAET